MKKVAYILILGSMVVMSSCKDNSFFKTESPSAMDITVFTAPSQIEQVIAGVYAMLAEQNSYRSRLGGPWVAMSTDIEGYLTSASDPQPDYATYGLTKAGDSNGDLIAPTKHPWAYLTMAIERANICIDGIEKHSDLSQKDFQYLYGEALTLRAWLSLEMVKLWGDVPASFKPLDVTDEKAIYPYKTDRNVIFEQLRADLKKAAEMMPNSAEISWGPAKNNVERINREFALGLLARSDLMYAGLAMRPDNLVQGSPCNVQFNVKDDAKRVELLNEVMWACEEVMDADGGLTIGGKLKTNYEDVFKAICGSVNTYSSTETLWEIPFADNVRGQWLNRVGAYVDKSAFNHLIHTTGSSKSNAKVVIPPYFVLEFDKNDTRKWVTANPYRWTYDGKCKAQGIPTGNVLYQDPTHAHEITLGKYRFEWITFDTNGDEDGINIPIMRYSDVLLMYAEAAIGSVSGVTPTYSGKYNAQDVFNTIRRRAGLGDLTLTMENLQKERAFEFCGEQIRKYDLMRWGIFAKTLKESQAKLHYFETMYQDTAMIDFSGTPYQGHVNDKLYIKYKNEPAYSKDGADAYRISDIYGLAMDEVGVPAGWDDDPNHNGWIRTDIYLSGSEGSKKPSISVGNGASQFCLYRPAVEDKLEYRQYWPLFNIILASNPNLYNDYNY